VASVYLETSFFSTCATIRTSPLDAVRRATSVNWWNNQAKAFTLYVSPEVVRELLNPNFPATVRDPALEMLRGLNELAFTEEVSRVAGLLVGERVMPGPAVEGDALHMSFCIVHGVDYLLTWNQKHLANPNKRTHLAVICARLKRSVPQVVTPDLMIVEDDDE